MTCLVFALVAAPVRPGIVLGESMAPTFRSGQVFLTSRVNDASMLRQGDVVLFSLNGQLLLKRIYAVGGQRVWVLSPPDNPSVIDRIVPPAELMGIRHMIERRHGAGELAEMTVPSGHVFVIGDSQFNSLDSRHFGPVPVEDVRGRVIVSRLFSLWGGEGPGAPVALAQEPGRSGP
jgi:signal peptidase I